MSRLQQILDSGRAPGMNTKAQDPTNVDIAAPRAFKAMEQQMGTSALVKQLRMSPKYVKKVWGI